MKIFSILFGKFSCDLYEFLKFVNSRKNSFSSVLASKLPKHFRRFAPRPAREKIQRI
uniref:Uncharacterized protein n=1 Tax=Romanomermis culicivorax TaxID=13658 RepID=A0A915IWE1_ROMCU